MKISLIATSSLYYPSPVGRWFPLAKEMVRLGHTVHLVTLHHNYHRGMENPYQKDGVWIHVVGQMHVRGWGDSRRTLGGFQLIGVALVATWALWRRARRLDVDAYHICKPQPMNGMAGLLAARWTGRPCYLDCDDYEAKANRFAHRGQKLLVRWFEDSLPRRMAGVSVNSRFLAERVRGLGADPQRIVYVPNGVDWDRFAALDHRAGLRLRQQYGLQDRPTVLYAGTLSLTGHPLRLLIEAFAQMLPRVPAARLVLVGGGEDRPVLERQVQKARLQEQVTFVGPVPPEQVPAYLLLGDVSVDPVMDDAVARARSPLKVLESMACAIPVVTGDVGDRRELLAGGQAGLLVRPGEAGALAEGIASLLLDPERRAQMGAAGRQQVQTYRWDRQVLRFLSLYGPATG